MNNLEGIDAVRNEGVNVVESVGSWSDAKHGADEGPGVHVAIVSKHLLLEVGPCSAVLIGVEDGPVVGSSLSVAE